MKNNIQYFTQDEIQLVELMSDISERCACAQWLDRTEYILWEAIQSGPRDWVFDRITEEDIKQLKDLSDKTQSWIIFNPNDGNEEYSEDEYHWVLSLDEWDKWTTKV